MKKINSTLLLFLLVKITISQNVVPSKAYISTFYNNQKQFSLSEGAYVFCSEGNQELTITFDFSKFKSGVDSLDEWLDDLVDSKLIFKGKLNTDNLLSLTHHNTKSIKINGILSFNGISHPHSFELNLFEIMKEGLLYSNNSQDYYDRLSANLHFNFSAKEYKLNKKPHHLKKTISIVIYKAAINEVKPGMELWLSPNK